MYRRDGYILQTEPTFFNGKVMPLCLGFTSQFSLRKIQHWQAVSYILTSHGIGFEGRFKAMKLKPILFYAKSSYFYPFLFLFFKEKSRWNIWKRINSVCQEGFRPFGYGHNNRSFLCSSVLRSVRDQILNSKLGFEIPKSPINTIFFLKIKTAVTCKN